MLLSTIPILKLPSLTVGLLTSVQRANQIDNWHVAGNKCRMDRIGRKKIAIARTQRVILMTDAQFQCTTDNPVRLIFGVRVWSVIRAGRVAPLKNAEAFALQTLS